MRHRGRRWGRAVHDDLRILVRDGESADDSADDSGDDSGDDSPSPTSTTFSLSTSTTTSTALATLLTTLTSTTTSVSLPPTGTLPSTTLSTTQAKSTTSLISAATSLTLLQPVLSVPSASAITSLTTLPSLPTTVQSVPASSSSSLATQSGNGPGQPDGSRQQKSQEQGMNSSTKLGIAMGTIAGVALLCVAIFCAYKGKRRSRAVAYEDQYRNGFEDGRRSRQMPDTTSYIMGNGRYTGYGSHASIAPTAYITGVDDYIDEKNATAYGHYSVGSSGSPPLPVIPNSGDVNSFGQRPYSFLNRPPSISTGTETTSEPVQNGELLSLYARSSRGPSWFLPQRNHKPESTLYGNQQAYAGVDISNPVPGPLESVQQPARAHVEFPSRAARMSTTVTEKTSETVTTESTWNTWGVDQRKTLKGNGVVARWLEKSGFK